MSLKLEIKESAKPSEDSLSTTFHINMSDVVGLTKSPVENHDCEDPMFISYWEADENEGGKVVFESGSNFYQFTEVEWETLLTFIKSQKENDKK